MNTLQSASPFNPRPEKVINTTFFYYVWSTVSFKTMIHYFLRNGTFHVASLTIFFWKSLTLAYTLSLKEEKLFFISLEVWLGKRFGWIYWNIYDRKSNTDRKIQVMYGFCIRGLFDQNKILNWGKNWLY